jgi:1,4-dihydroxy-2-naphthoate octaprenyltransferase
VGLLATAILVANNLRDIATDRKTGKRTLAVRLSPPRTRTLYRTLVAAAFAAAAAVALVAHSPWPLVALGGVPLARRPLELIGRPDGPALIAALVATARLELATGVLLAVGLWAAL